MGVGGSGDEEDRDESFKSHTWEQNYPGRPLMKGVQAAALLLLITTRHFNWPQSAVLSAKLKFEVVQVVHRVISETRQAFSTNMLKRS